MNDNKEVNKFYNTKVRQAISDEYVKCSKEKSKTVGLFERLSLRLANEKDSLIYSEYLKLKDETEHLRKTAEELQIKIDIWDKAREICLNIADELR